MKVHSISFITVTFHIITLLQAANDKRLQLQSQLAKLEDQRVEQDRAFAELDERYSALRTSERGLADKEEDLRRDVALLKADLALKDQTYVSYVSFVRFTYSVMLLMYCATTHLSPPRHPHHSSIIHPSSIHPSIHPSNDCSIASLRQDAIYMATANAKLHDRLADLGYGESSSAPNDHDGDRDHH